MNKNEFIEAIRKSENFPQEADIEATCAYLESKLSDDIEIAPETFLEYFRLSLDIFRHLNEVETQRQLDSIMNSIEDAMTPRSDDLPPVTEEVMQKAENETSDAQPDTDISVKNIGIWQKICARKGIDKAIGITVFSAVTVLLSPLFLVIALLCFAFYAVPIITATAVMLVILVPTIVLAVLAVIALSYGIAALFTSVPIGLMEIGLGTVLFSLSIALWAVNLRLFTFIIPFLVTKITVILKKVFSRPFFFVFGKEVK